MTGLHILRQSSGESIFTWHVDTDDDSENGGETSILSQVYLLTNTRTSMQVAGFDEVEYNGPGSGFLFFSDATHRSGFAQAGTIKIAFFFGHAKSETDQLVPSYPLYEQYFASTDTFSHQVGCRYCNSRPNVDSSNHTKSDSIQCGTCKRWIHMKCISFPCNLVVDKEPTSFTCTQCIRL